MYRFRRPLGVVSSVKRWWTVTTYVAPALISCALCVLFYKVVADQALQSALFSNRHLPIVTALTLSRLSIIGGDNVTPSALEQAVGIDRDDKLLHISVAKLKRSINDLPFTETSVVERRFPGSIVIHLVERKPVAVWQSDHQFILIDKEGHPVNESGVKDKYSRDFTKLPLIVGSGAPEAVLSLIPALDAAPKVRELLSAAVRVGQRRWDLILRNGCIIRLPESNEQDTLRRLSQMEAREQLLERPLAEIDMRVPDKLILRKRAEEPSADAETTDQREKQPVAGANTNE